MEGAREFVNLFKTGQYEKLYITSSRHARGSTFHIQVLPEGEKAKTNGSNNLCLNSDAIEVYGVVSGNPGWTEKYGWLHEGKWQEDFKKLIISKNIEIEDKEKQSCLYAEETEQQRCLRVKGLLSNY